MTALEVFRLVITWRSTFRCSLFELPVVPAVLRILSLSGSCLQNVFDYDLLTGLVYGLPEEKLFHITVRKLVATALTTGALLVDMMPSAITASLSRLSFEMAKIC
ncbi:hypothetical protein CDAR_259281 [Caerostris darwini]|uniref:Uncharacterized protein n=1 Tax=Caerostris darwini TaxID=1538125 RepID=A0AAV4WXQ3_9ARAC|nr:hypothetical protein CDAR_259281 [Caerostris darwini]